MLKLDPGRAGTRRVAADPQSEAALELGGGLFEAVFTSDIRLAWARSIDKVRDARRGLRLRLRLTEAPAMAVLPWELLYDRRQNSFIAQSERTPVVRYLEVADTPRTLDVDGPLRILVVVASPTDLPELDVEDEWNRVNAALADRVSQGTVQLDRLEQPTLQALATWIRRHDVHVLHFVGYGEYDRQAEDGVLLLLRPVRSPRAGLVRRARPLPARPRPAAPDRPQRLPVRADGQRRTRPRDGSGPRPAGLRRRRHHAVPHQRRTPPPASPASSTVRSPTASRSTSRSAAVARPCSPRMRRSGLRRCCSSATPRAGCSTTSFRCRRTSPPVRATWEPLPWRPPVCPRGPPLWCRRRR